MPIKRPFDDQNGSCEGAISFDSTVTSPSTSEVLLLNHDYADPVDLRSSIKFEMEKVDRQRRQNLIYEPMTTTKTKQKDFNVDTEKPYKCSIQNWCLLFVFLVSSCSLALSLLITFGVIETKRPGMQEDYYDPATAKQVGSNGSKDVIVEGLKKNISVLSKQIPSFVRQLDALESQLKKLSVTESPQIGSTPQVTKRAGGKLSSCRYKYEISNKKYDKDHDAKKTSTTTSWVRGEEGFELVGASCSTIGGSQYGLYQKEMNGVMMFRCRCGGKSQTDAFVATELECRMHYWECPINNGAQ